MRNLFINRHVRFTLTQTNILEGGHIFFNISFASKSKTDSYILFSKRMNDAAVSSMFGSKIIMQHIFQLQGHFTLMTQNLLVI